MSWNESCLSCPLRRPDQLRLFTPPLARVPPHEEFQRNLSSNVTHRPWQDDPQCSEYDVRLGVRIPLMYLISYARSGNTWVRYLLDSATGIFTGSVFESEILYNLGFLGERVNYTDGTVLIVKTHRKEEFEFDRLTPKILIIRNPKHAIASLHIFRKGGKERFLRRGSQEDFETEKFSVLFNKHIVKWKQIVLQNLSSVMYLHITYYEDLKENPLSELLKMLYFLRVSPSLGRLACLTRHMEGPVNRGQPEFDPYTEEQEARIRAAVEEVSTALRKRSFPPLPYATQ